MNLSSDDESSDSETEYIRSNEKIDLKSLTPAKLTKRKIEEASNELTSDSDDEEDLPSYTNTELLSQILKNLEETNKFSNIQHENDSQVSQDSGIDVQENDKPTDKHNDSITNLLLQGEKNLNLSSISESSFSQSTEKEPERPITEGIEIVCPFSNDLLKRPGKKKQTLQDLLRAQLNKRLRAHQLLVHKVGILCWLSHGFYLNRLISNPEILAIALSLISPANYPQGKATKNYLLKFTVWFKKNFQLNKDVSRDVMNKSALIEILTTKVVKDERELALIYVAILRSMGINCRLVISLNPPERLVKKEKLMPIENENTNEKKQVAKEKESKSPTKVGKKGGKKVGKGGIVQNSAESLSKKRIEARQKAAAILGKINAAKDTIKSEKCSKENVRNKLSGFKRQTSKDAEKSKKDKEDVDLMDTDEESDDEFMKKPKRRATSPPKRPLKKKNSSQSRKLLSSDEEDEQKQLQVGNYWAEVYLDSEDAWICADALTGKVDCPNDIYKRAQKPVLYVVAWNSDGLIKDVTRRYCPRWLTITQKQRISEDWWEDAICKFKEKKDQISKAEDELLLKRELELPLPKTISECKGHPLYAITRHLLKYEALYPPDIVPLGYLPNGEAIYPRFCVHTLMSRQTWLKHARVVKLAQEPYKIVTSMPKYDKMTGTIVKDQNLELFGKWQTDPYVPPVAKDGIVPRNEYGNVDLFKKSMLPKGTVHLDLPGLARVAKKLDIDCAPAVVGFNFGGRGATPATQGYVVCSEFEHVLRDAWKTEQIEAEKRAKVKREKTIWGNWKKIIKGLLIREKLAYKYEFNDDKDKELKAV